MTIDIQALPGGLVQNASESVLSGASSEAISRPQATGATPSSDTVNLTESAARLRNLENTIGQLPVVDAQRVEGLQRQLATGSFSVDSENSAHKLLEMERNLP